MFFWTIWGEWTAFLNCVSACNWFWQENETKRIRAQKKAEEEAKARKDKESQIDTERKALQQAKLQKTLVEYQLGQSTRLIAQFLFRNSHFSPLWQTSLCVLLKIFEIIGLHTSDKRFFDYLQKVKEENETEFPEIEYIINRYSVLSSEQQNLLQKQLQLTAESEQLRQAFQQFSKEQANANLGLNNDIARMYSFGLLNFWLNIIIFFFLCV